MSDHSSSNPMNGAPMALTRLEKSPKRYWTALWARVLHLDLRETQVSTREFTVDDPQVTARIEQIGACFAHGFNSAMSSVELAETLHALQTVSNEDCGFAFEGAAMGLAVADSFQPRRRLFEAFIDGPGHHHEYMAWVGLGWALARLPVSALWSLRRHRSLNKWLALDGFGFHEGYFGWRKSILNQRRPRSMQGLAGHVFDQGLGRSLWFVLGASPARIATTIASFQSNRQADLWSGVGLAATYAGGVAENHLKRLLNSSGSYANALAQGVVFAAEARRRAGNPVHHSELACKVVLALPLRLTADLATRCKPEGDDLSSYQEWRRRIQLECATILGNRCHTNREQP
ncbi:DUF1702 family protein [Hydrogenophaga luteola]|uniref:DUF1702 family protein n=1 Tax=Hydrogenophaga luteola TaxID=1591122 RepID=A0ABV7W843_9BURK